VNAHSCKIYRYAGQGGNGMGRNEEDAVSKLFILIIIALIVICGIISAYVFVFPPGQQKVPRFTATIESSGKTVYIYHDGGDPVVKGSILIRINNETIPPQAISFLHAQDWPWSAGKTLKIEYPGSGQPETVQITHTSGSVQMVYSLRNSNSS